MTWEQALRIKRGHEIIQGGFRHRLVSKARAGEGPIMLSFQSGLVILVHPDDVVVITDKPFV